MAIPTISSPTASLSAAWARASNKKWLYVLGGIVVLIAIGGIIEHFNPTEKAKPPAASVTAPTPTPTPVTVSPAEKLSQAKPLATGLSSKEDLIKAADLLKTIPSESPEHKEAQPILKFAEERIAKLNAEDAIIGPSPDVNPLTGTVRPVDKYLQNVLNDYSDSEYVAWSPVIRTQQKDGPYWVVKLRLRAKNAFGAKILKDAIFFIRHNQVIKVEGL
ncbi:MAG TPA: hypothetical protein VF528_11295 [Pyrinomonadaceae bacterium]|jgi:hypothetical protein